MVVRPCDIVRQVAILDLCEEDIAGDTHHKGAALDIFQRLDNATSATTDIAAELKRMANI